MDRFLKSPLKNGDGKRFLYLSGALAMSLLLPVLLLVCLLAPLPAVAATNANYQGMYAAQDDYGGTDGCIITQIAGNDTLANPLEDPVCVVLTAFNGMMHGTTSRALAAIAVIALGCAALFGKMSWPQGLILTLGIAALFGAVTIVKSLGVVPSVGTQQGTDPISIVLSFLTNQITGTTGRAVASSAIMILGVSALLGKIEWKQGLMLTLGLAMVFGAANILNNVRYATDKATNATTTGCALGTYAPIPNITVNTPGGLPVGLSVSVPAPPVIDFTVMFNNLLFGNGLPTIQDPCMGFFALIHAMTGEMGTSVATLGIMICGFLAMFGRLSWPRAMLLAVGVALIFAASNVVALLTQPLNPCTELSSDPFTQVLCGFVAALQGQFGKMLATLGIIIVGVLSLLGKISWELGLIVTLGISLLFGADAIVELFNSSLSGISCSMAPTSPLLTGNSISDVICYVLNVLYGPPGKSMATIAVLMLGISALMGKVSFSKALVVAGGIAIAFGAPMILGTIMYIQPFTGCHLPLGNISVSLSGVSVRGNGGGSTTVDTNVAKNGGAGC